MREIMTSKILNKNDVKKYFLYCQSSYYQLAMLSCAYFLQAPWQILSKTYNRFFEKRNQNLKL